MNFAYVSYFGTGGCRVGVTEAFKEVGRHVECLVVLGDDGDLAVGWIQLPRVQESETACGWDIEPEAPVLVVGWANVETIGGMGGPQCTSG